MGDFRYAASTLCLNIHSLKRRSFLDIPATPKNKLKFLKYSGLPLSFLWLGDPSYFQFPRWYGFDLSNDK